MKISRKIRAVFLPLGAMGGSRNWQRKGERKLPGMLVVVPVGAWVHGHVHLSEPGERTIKMCVLHCM